MAETKGKRINVIIDEETHRHIKALAAEQGKTLAESIREAIIEKVEKERGK